MDAREVSDRLRHARNGAFRLETLQYYDGDAAELEEFRHGRPLPERSITTSAYLRRLAVTTLDGLRWSRVHVVDQPITDYIRFEITGYVESAAVGEQIWLADRAASPELGSLRQDFWLVDDGLPEAAVLLMDYDEDGQLTGARFARDAETLARCRQERDLALRHATPLNEWVAAVREGQRVA